MRADELGDDGTGDDNTSNTKGGDDDDAVNCREVVGASDGHGARACCHHPGEEDHEVFYSALGDGNEYQCYDSASDDAEAHRHGAQADPDGFVAPDIKDLSRIEEEHDEEVGAGEEGDEQDADHGAFVLGEDLRGQHGIFGKFGFVDEEGDDDYDSHDEGDKDVHRSPCVLQTLIQDRKRSSLGLTCSAPHCMPIMNSKTPIVLRRPPM